MNFENLLVWYSLKKENKFWGGELSFEGEPPRKGKIFPWARGEECFLKGEKIVLDKKQGEDTHLDGINHT